MYESITRQTAAAVNELLTVARLQPGDILVVGCSSSEVLGEKIGTGSSMEVAGAVMDGLLPLLQEQSIYLAAQ